VCSATMRFFLLVAFYEDTVAVITNHGLPALKVGQAALVAGFLV